MSNQPDRANGRDGRALPRRLRLLQRGMALLSRVAPSIAAWEAERLWFRPPRRSRRVVRAERAKHSDLRWFEVRVAGRLRPGFVIGEGPLVLAVHGWGGQAAQLGRLATRLAEAGFRVASLDLPGHGEDRRHRSDPFQMAEAMRALRDLLGHPQAVVAHSLGAFASTLAFADDPPPALVFLAPGLAAGPFIERFATMLGLSAEATARLNARLQRVAGELWPVVRDGPDLTLAGTRLLVVRDPADPDASHQVIDRLVARRPETRLVETPGTGHRRILEDTQVLDVIADFLAVSQGASASEARASSVP